MKRTIVAVCTASLLMWNLCAYAGDEASDNAFYNGVTAYRAFKFDEAAHWFLLAAEAGDTDAQFLLGRMHYDGNSLSVDNVTAYMWFDIAASNGLTAGARYRDGIAKRMSEEDVALAKQRANEWRRSHPASVR